jgi:uncharacterized membrane protein YgdD (TMEM256/DUF423 family)
LFIAACCGFLAVALGAFGAHALKPHLSAEQMQWFETASRYHFYHALALLFAARMVKKQKRWPEYSCVAFLLGIILFSGSLYVMAVSGMKSLGIITPAGGLCFLAGWALLAAHALSPKSRNEQP